MKSSYNLSIDDERAVEQFTQSMIENSVKIFRAMRKLQNQVQQHAHHQLKDCEMTSFEQKNN